MEPLFAAATRILASALPKLVEWIATALAEGRDPEAELLAMIAAEEAAREAERQKFGGS